MGSFIVWYLIMLICGALIGLIPYGMGRFLNKPRFGQLGLILCAISTLLHPSMPLVLAVGFVVAMLLMRHDIRYPGNQTPVVYQPAQPIYTPVSAMQLICVAGPLKGQSYTIGTAGLTIGRDHGCVVQIPDHTPGISRCHCSIRYQQGALALVDMGSAYGTFLDNGTKLPPNYPMQLIHGSRFYLGSPNIMFEVRYR